MTGRKAEFNRVYLGLRLLGAKFRFLWSRNQKLIIFLGASIILEVIFSFPQIYTVLLKNLVPAGNLLKRFYDMINPFVGITTLLAVIFIFLNENEQDWTNALPKRVIVNFFVDTKNSKDEPYEHLFLRCENAFLAHEADLRNWGQQIGRQMCGGENAVLSLKPKIVLRRQSLILWDSAVIYDTPFRQYEITFFLKEYPKPLNPPVGWDEGKKNNRTLIWTAPFFKNEWSDKIFSLNKNGKVEIKKGNWN